MMHSKRTRINDIKVKYWFNHKKDSRLTLNWDSNEITFLGESAIIKLMEWLEKRRFHQSP